MKKTGLVSMIMVLCLLLSMSVCALGETAVSTETFHWYDAELCKNIPAMIVRTDRSEPYALVDVSGKLLTTEPYCYMRDRDVLIEVAVDKDALNGFGAIDGDGQEVLPMQYGDIDYLSDRWVIGVVLEPATEDNYDYTTFGSEKQFFLVKQYDVYYCGELVGTLGRTEYKSGTAFGAYLLVRDRAGNSMGYDAVMTPSSYQDNYYGEFDDDYRTKTVYHTLSGMQAFTPDCTLTSADVKCGVMICNKQLLDLQGNVLAEADYETTYSFYGDYAYVKSNGQYGMIDKTGALVLPFEMDDMEYASGDVFFASGYQLVSRDGKLCWADPAEGIVFVSGVNSAVSHRVGGAFAHVEDDNGNRIVITPLGQLPVHYKEVSTSNASSARIVVVQNADEAAGVIGMAGEEIIPLDGTYTSTSRLSVSMDGTLVLGDKGREGSGNLHEYVLYTVAYDPAGLSVAPVDDGSWTCPSCQTANAGKFCSECGTKKPE